MSDGIEKLKDEIVSKAKEHASLLIKEANDEAQRIIKDAEIKIENKKKEADEESKCAIESIKKKELIKAGLEAKKIGLEAKKSLIDEVFENSRQKISAMNDSKRSNIITSLHKKMSNEIEVGKVYCSKKDSKFVKGSEFQIQEMFGGLIAESTDGKIRVDYSFDTIFESIREDELKNIADMLFSESEKDDAKSKNKK